jgi:hypothetical protein
MIPLLHRHTLRQVPRLVHVRSAAHADEVGEELEGDYVDDGLLPDRCRFAAGSCASARELAR